VIVVCTGAVSSNSVEKTMLPDCVWILQAWLVYVSERKGDERGERRSWGWRRVSCGSDYCVQMKTHYLAHIPYQVQLKSI